MNAFNSSRLLVARKRRMLTKKAFAEAIGVTQQTVTRWERGNTADPSEDNLTAISRVLGFPKEFFFGADVEVPRGASFRSQTSMSAAAREAALSAGTIAYLISDWAEKGFSLPAANLPDLQEYSPEEAARTLREEWRLGEKPISNMVHLLESKGVHVFSLAENTLKVDAYSLWRQGRPFVFLNTLKSAERSRFDAGHELGHLVLHQDGGAEGRQAEDQANQFAAEFLMPRADVLATIRGNVSLETLIALKGRWRVSVAALAYRCHKLGLISDWKYRDICIEMATRGINRNEPSSIERERSQMWDKVLKAMWAERVSPAKIAETLKIPASELNDMLFATAGERVHTSRGLLRTV